MTDFETRAASTVERPSAVAANSHSLADIERPMLIASKHVPLLNGGSCTEEPGSNIESTRSAFSCSCTDLFEGDMCERHVPSLWSVGDCALHIVLAVSALVCFQYAPSIYSRALPAAAKAALAGALTQSRDYAVDITTPSASLTCSSDGSGDQRKAAPTSGDCEHSFRDTCPYTQTG